MLQLASFFKEMMTGKPSLPGGFSLVVALVYPSLSPPTPLLLSRVLKFVILNHTLLYVIVLCNSAGTTLCRALHFHIIISLSTLSVIALL